MSLAGALTAALGEMLAPLAVALAGDPDDLASLLEDLGWTVELAEEQVPAVAAILPVGDQVGELLGLLDRHEAGTLETGDFITVGVPLAEAVFDSIGALRTLSAGGLDGLVAPLDDPATWAAIALDLPEYLFLRWVRLHHPVAFAVLVLAGVVEAAERGGELPPAYTFSWSALGGLLADPPGHLATVYRWDADFDHPRLFAALGGLARAMDAEGRLGPLRDTLAAEHYDGPAPADVLELDVPLHRGAVPDGLGYFLLGLLAAPVPESGRGDPDGVLVTHEIAGDAGASVDLGGGWTLELTGTADGSGTLGVTVHPSGVGLAGGAATAGVAIRLTGEPDRPWPLLGDADGTRLELRRLELELSVEGSAAEPDLVLSAGSGADGLALVIDPGEGDSFLAGVLGGTPLSLATGLALRWSSASGFTLGGQVGVEVVIALDLQLGPVRIDSVRVALVGGDEGGSVEITATGSLTLGPIVAVVQDIGVRAALTPVRDGPGGFGSVDAQLAFRPPTGLGIGVDVEGVVTGGGFLSLDYEAGRYAGVAQLAMLGFGLTVIGIVQTELPDDPDGWSFFLSVIADFTPIQLGFGFTLNGVGGFMGLHRTLDDVALVEGVREGRLDSLMFPENVLADAVRILADIEAYFPSLADHHAFGAMVKIGWGTPSLITAEVGAILTVPDFRLALIGELACVLPDDELALIELHMGVVGVIDVAAGTLTITASIYDSQLVGVALSGDMATYLSLGAAPYFLFSVGGFSPGWSPPSTVPSSLRDLRRMAASIDLAPVLEVGIDTYLAITPNTLQFGSEVYAVARVHALGVDFSADGSFGFDVQITFSPFLIVADMHAGVAIRVEGEPLLSTQLRLHLEGPDPWSGSGYAEFRFLGRTCHFQVEVGSGVADDAADTVSLWPELEAALADPDNWVAAASTTVLPEVSLRPLDPVAETGLWLAPDSRIEVRQGVLPLNRDIEAYGALVPTGEDRFDVEAAGLAAGTGTSWTALRDWFAPAQFTAMSAAERLSAPSYELMDAGVSLTGTGVTVPTAAANLTSVTLGYEQTVLEPEETGAAVFVMLSADRVLTGPAGAAGATSGPAGRYAVTVPAFAVGTTRYTVAGPLDADPVLGMVGSAPSAGPPALAYADAVGLRRALRGWRPAGEGRLRIVPSHAAAGRFGAADAGGPR